MLTCSKCGSQVEEQAKFCTECGTPVSAVPQQCPHCGRDLEPTDKFCVSCGQQVGSVPQNGQRNDPLPPPQIVADCQRCEHFRRAVPISGQLPIRGSGKATTEVLLKIQEDEGKQRVSEAKHKSETMRISRLEWGFRPLMSDYCAAKAAEDKYEIHELKNRGGNCPDYKPRTPETTRRAKCLTCMYKQARQDPYAKIPPGPPGHPEITGKMYDAVDSQWANEVIETYYQKGRISHMPEFHDYCSYKSTGTTYIALPYPNIQGDCPDYEPRFGPVLSDI